MKQKVLVILGPTASGKSDLAVTLAHKFNGEIISADSRQVYEGLDIGSGKITKREMRGIPHHLLDVAKPKKQFSASDYKKLADKSLANIFKNNKLPIIVGGTGLYIDTLLGIITLPEVPPNAKLRKVLSKKSTAQLFTMLQKLDPARAKTIDRKNPVRLVRAIEIAQSLGKVPKDWKQVSPYSILFIGLLPDPMSIQKRIHNRLNKRALGIVKEVRNLQKQGLSWKRLNELGLEYRYVSWFVRDLLTKKETLTALEREIWGYAKRQMTWFKKNKKIHWFNPDNKKATVEIEKLAKKFLRK